MGADRLLKAMEGQGLVTSRMTGTRRPLTGWLWAIIFAVVAVLIGDQVGRVMGLSGWWLAGLGVIEAIIGLLCGLKMWYIIC